MSEARYPVAEMQALVQGILVAHDTAPNNAAAVAEALVLAQIDGQGGHGLARVAPYSAQARSGKVKGHAVPELAEAGTAAARIDAGHGFAFPALDLAIDWLATRTPETGIAMTAIHRSHHFGAAGRTVERLAEAGLVGLVVGNTPAAMPPWGGSKSVFGTNPIAFAAPREGGEASMVIDMSLSKVARGKIVAAAKAGKAIEEGVAVDAQGRPTTDAQAAVDGSLLPMGDAKGAALALMVEVLAAPLTGSQLSSEASSFFSAEGPPPGVGQTLIAFAPGPLSGGRYADRLEVLFQTMLGQEGVRLPGARRIAARKQAETEGVPVPDAIYAELQSLL